MNPALRERTLFLSRVPPVQEERRLTRSPLPPLFPGLFSSPQPQLRSSAHSLGWVSWGAHPPLTLPQGP